MGDDEMMPPGPVPLLHNLNSQRGLPASRPSSLIVCIPVDSVADPVTICSPCSLDP